MTVAARSANRRRRNVADGFDVFVSYSHAADVLLAPVLQRLIRRVGRPWYSRATLRAFRDTTNLPMSESLWGSIQGALNQSRSFVLLASPGAARSPWVDREVRFWRENRDRSSLVIVLTAGEIIWDETAIDFAESSTAIPPGLRGWYEDEPSWLDLRPPAGIAVRWSQRNDRLRDAARTIAAPLYGIDKDQLEGEDERESRRARRTLAGGAVALVLLTVLAIIGAFVAVGQASLAREQARIALSGELAAVSSAERTRALDVAGLLAVQAYAADPNARSRAALLGAATAAGQLVRYVPFPVQIQSVAASKDGRVVVVGLEDGTVWRWRTSAKSPERIAKLAQPVLSVATNTTGDVIAGASLNGVMLSRTNAQPLVREDAALDATPQVALSDSGRTLVVTLTDSQGRRVQVVDVATATARELGQSSSTGVGLAVATDDDVLILDGSGGSWERRRLSNWSLIAEGAGDFKNTIRDSQLAAGGGSFIYADDSPDALVWRTDRPAAAGAAPFTLRAPIGNPVAVALSPDGTIGAVADTGTVYVGPIAAADQPRATATALLGNGSIDPGSVRFLGNSQLIASSGTRIVLWDLTATDRLAKVGAVPLDAGCHACGPPKLQVAPDGTTAFVADGSGFSGEFVSLPELTTRGERIAFGGTTRYQGSSWTRRGDHLVVLIAGVMPSDPPPLPATLVQVNGKVVATGPGPGDTDIVAVMADGQVLQIDAITGRLTELSAALVTDLPSSSSNAPIASVGSTGLAAFAQDQTVTIVDPISHTSRTHTMANTVTAVTIAATRVLIRTTSGATEVWNSTLTAQERVIPTETSDYWAPVASPTGDMIAQLRSDSTVRLTDVATGTELATFRAASTPGLRVGIGFTSDGNTIVTATEAGAYGVTGNGVLVSRLISADELIRIVCETAGRDLTNADWSQAVDAPAPTSLTCPS